MDATCGAGDASASRRFADKAVAVAIAEQGEARDPVIRQNPLGGEGQDDARPYGHVYEYRRYQDTTLSTGINRGIEWAQ